MSESSVTAVIVNYRSGDLLEACLDALIGSGPLERVIVVDNASGDDSWRPAGYRAARGQAELIRSDVNLGLAAAVNLVLPTITTDYLAILNPDTVPTAGWLEPLIAALDRDERVAIACPIVTMADSGKVNAAGQFLHVSGLGFTRMLGRDPAVVGECPHRVGGFSGAAFVIRTDVLRSLGGWDDTGFLYHEDVALAWDLALLGRSIVCVPESHVAHHYHLTMYPEKLHLLERNRWALLRSHLSLRLFLRFLPGILLTEVLVWGGCLVRGPSFVRAKVNAVRWFVSHQGSIRAWRQRVLARPYDPHSLTEILRWAYPWDQLVGVVSERGRSTRRPPGGLPV